MYEFGAMYFLEEFHMNSGSDCVRITCVIFRGMSVFRGKLDHNERMIATIEALYMTGAHQ